MQTTPPENEHESNAPMQPTDPSLSIQSNIGSLSWTVKEKAIDRSINAIAITDKDGNIAYVNDSLKQMFGYRSDELIGVPVIALWEKKGNYVQIIDSLMKHDGWFGELAAVRKDSHVFEVQLSATMINNDQGEPLAFMNSFVDINAQKQSEKKLLESEENYRTVVETANAIITIIDKDGKYHFMNSTAAQLFGGVPQDFIGKTIWDTFPEDVANQQIEDIKKSIDTKKMINLTTPIVFQGKTQWFESRIQAINDAGESTSALLIATDITDLKNTEEKLKEANLIINRGNAVAFLWKNADGWPVEFVTENVENLSGYSSEDFTSGNVSFMDLIHVEDKDKVYREFEGLSENGKSNEFLQTYRIVTKLNKVKWIEDKIYIRRDESGAISHYEGVIYDITKLKNAERKVRESERMKTEFMNIAAHELKTPLIPVQGYLEMLQTDKGLTEEQEKWTRICLKNVDNLKSLVDEILDVARLESNSMKFSFSLVNLSELLSDVADDLKPQFVKQNLQFSLDSPNQDVLVNVDERRIKQVVRNFISNSLKSTDDGSVDLHLINKDGCAVVEVHDTGIGISKENIDKLFQKFSQVGSSETRKAKGTGLGLYICKKIVEKHNGTINVDSEGEGKGSTFSFSIPLI